MKNLLVLIVPCFALLAQSIPLGEEASLSYKGLLGVEHHYFLHEATNNSQPNAYTRLLTHLDLTFQSDLPFQIRVNTHLLLDTENSDYNRYEIKDAYIDYFSDSYEIRAGYQVFSWKTVESLSQADFLNQTDLENDIFSPEKFGELALRVRYIPDTDTEQTLAFYYIPYFRTTKYPIEENRYSFIPALSNNEDLFRYQSKNKRWRPQAAIRYQTILFDNFDTSMFIFNGYHRFPGVIPDTFPARQYLHDYRTLTHTGFTFQGELNRWLLKGEFNYTLYEHRVSTPKGAVRPEYLSYTTGFEYTFYAPFIPNQDLGIILEAIGDSDSGKDPSSLGRFSPFQNHLFLALRYAFNNIGDRSILVGAFIDYKKNNTIAQLTYEERLFNVFRVKLVYDYLDTNTAPLSAFKNNDRLKLKFSYHF